MIKEIEHWGFAKAYGPIMGMKFKRKDGACAIYMKLALCSILARKERRLPSPSVAQMALDWGCNPSQMLRALRRLEKGKLIIVKRRFHRLNDYSVMGDVLKKYLPLVASSNQWPEASSGFKQLATCGFKQPESTANLVASSHTLQIKREEEETAILLVPPSGIPLASPPLPSALDSDSSDVSPKDVDTSSLSDSLAPPPGEDKEGDRHASQSEHPVVRITNRSSLSDSLPSPASPSAILPTATLSPPDRQPSPTHGEDKQESVTRGSQSESPSQSEHQTGPFVVRRDATPVVDRPRKKMTPEERQAFIDRDRARLGEKILGLKDEARTTADLLSDARTK